MQRYVAGILLALMVLTGAAVKADVWEKTVLDSTGTAAGVNCDVVLDSQGHPHVAYTDYDLFYLKYAHYDGTQWHIESIDSFGIAGLHAHIALDSEDRPHIAYTGHLNNARYMYLSDAGWSSHWVDSGVASGNQAHKLSLAIDSADGVHLAWINDAQREIRYGTFDGDEVSVETVASVGASFYVNLLLRDGWTPYIGYHVVDSLYLSDTLHLAMWNEGEDRWDIETVSDDICVAGVFYQSFDMDSQGNCYFAYERQSSLMPVPTCGLGDKRLAKFDGSTWTYETIPEPDPDPWEFIPTFPLYLKIDQNDNPAFLADTVLFWKRDGSSWEFFNLGNQMNEHGVAVYNSMAFDQYNSPTMVFGQPWLVYYKLYPGDPQIQVPTTAHTYSQNYEVWNCVIDNLGEAPLIIEDLTFARSDSMFQLVADPTPLYIFPLQSDSVSIRFVPDEELAYHDTLTILSNDSADPEILVALEGTGEFSDSTGTIVVQAQDCYASPEYHAINYDLPLQGAQLSFLQSGQLKYGPIVTDQNGTAMQAGITPGTYDMQIVSIVDLPRDDRALDTLMHTVSVDIAIGLNADTVVLPESLMVQSYQYVYDLSHIESGGDTFVYGAEAWGSDCIRDMLDLWQLDLDSNKIESASRLILAQQMVDRMFPVGESLGKKGFEGIADLLHFAVKATDSKLGWIGKLLKIIKLIWDLWAGDKVAALMSLLEMLAKYIILELIDMVIDQVASELPCLIDPASGAELVCGGPVLQAVWADIKGNFSEWDLPEGGSHDSLETSWNHLNNLAYDRARYMFMQVIYVDILTNPKLEDAKHRSENFEYTHTFPEASEESTDRYLQMKYLVDNINYAADQLILTADLLMKTYIVLSIADGFIPGLNVVEEMKIATMYASIGLDIAATGTALGGFFTIPGELGEAMHTIYYPYSKAPPRPGPPNLATAAADAELMAMLQQRVRNSVNAYDSTLGVVKDHIQAHEIEDAMFATGDLALADVQMMHDVSLAAAPLYSVIAAVRDSLTGFAGLYDDMIVAGGDAGMCRLFDYLALVQLPADSSQEMKDFLVDHLDSASQRTHEWSDGIIEMFDSIVGVEIPAIVAASQSNQDLYALDPSQTATVTVRLQNVGALQADSISVIFETNDGLMLIDPDSIYVGSLAVGEESPTYTWRVTIGDTTFQQGVWTARVVASNAQTYWPDGTLSLSSDISSDVHGPGETPELPKRFGLNQNYPNPFNASTHIEYMIARKCHARLTVINLLGREVAVLADGPHVPRAYSTSWQADEFASGVYFYRLEIDGQTAATKKMVLLK